MEARGRKRVLYRLKRSSRGPKGLLLKLRTVLMTSPLEERTGTVVPLGMERYIFILETKADF